MPELFARFLVIGTLAFGGGQAALPLVERLGVTLIALARPIVDIHPMLLLGAAAVFAAELRGLHPIVLIVAATLIGAVLSIVRITCKDRVRTLRSRSVRSCYE